MQCFKMIHLLCLRRIEPDLNALNLPRNRLTVLVAGVQPEVCLTPICNTCSLGALSFIIAASQILLDEMNCLTP